MTFFYDLNKKLKEVAEAPKSVHQQLNEGKAAVDEAFPDPATIAGSLALGGALGAVKGRYDDMKYRERGRTFGEPESDWDKPRTTMQRLRAAAGVPSKNDPNVQKADEGLLGTIGQTLGKGIKKAGKALGGPNDQELLANLQDRMYPDLDKVGKAAMKPAAKPLPMAKPRTPITKEEYGPLEEKGGEPMTPKQKKFAKLAPPADKITFADKIAGAKQEVDEMLGDVAAEAMKSALRGGQKKLDVNKNGKIDGQDLAMLRAGKGKKQETDESALQAYLGKKKYGEQGMKALQKAGREGASEKTMDRIRDQHDKMDEGWDDMIKDVDKRRGEMKKGEKKQGHKGEIEKTDKGIKHTRRYDDKTGETDTGDDDTPKGEKRRGRPKGTGKAMGAKGPSGKSKLMTKESDNESDDIRQAMAMLKKAGYKVTKAAEQELDEKAVSQQQQKFMGMVHAMQKGEKVKGASPELKKVARGMKKSDAEDFAATKHKGLPKKVRAKEEVEETTVSGSVAPATDAPKSKGKGGISFGKGIYDSMNRELEQMIAESMNVSMNMSNNPDGGPTKSLTVTATDEDAEYLGKLLKMAGVGGDAGGCGCGQQPCACNSAEQVDENQPDWPTDEVESDDALQYAGGLNKPKTTVAGDGQTTVPVTAVQVREGEEQYKRDLRKLLESAGIEVTDEMLDEGWKEKLAAAGTAAAIGAAGLGMMGGGQAPSTPQSTDTVSSMNAKFQQNRSEEAAMDQRAQAFSKINKDFSDQYVKLIDQRQAEASSSDSMTAKMMFYTRLEKLLKQYNAMEESVELGEQEQVMAVEEGKACDVCDESPCKCESVEESLSRFRSLAGIKEAAKPDYIDLDKDGNRKESMKKAADDKEDKKVEESILAMTNLWKAYKG